MKITINLVSILLMIASLFFLQYMSPDIYNAILTLLGAFACGVVWRALTTEVTRRYD